MANPSTEDYYMRCMASCILFILMINAGVSAGEPNPATLRSTRGSWPLHRQWTLAEVNHYAAWINHIYAMKTTGTRVQRLAKLDHVLSDPEMNQLMDPAFVGEPANPQLDADTIHAMHSIIDCGKLGVALCGYYAYRRGLPWMATYVKSGDGEDIRRASFTIPSGAASCLDYPSASTYFRDMVQGFCTGNMRVPPVGQNGVLSDTVPVAITREALKPGALFYFPGHVMVVADIAPGGRIAFMDATTHRSRDIRVDRGLTALSGVAEKGKPANKRFTGFRIFRYPIAETNANGEVTRVRRRTDEEMAVFGYNLEQYEAIRLVEDGGAIPTGPIQAASFEEYVVTRMRKPGPVNPSKVIENAAKRLLARMEQREERVKEAWNDFAANGPISFPENLTGKGRAPWDIENVYNARGRWGQFSTTLDDLEFRAEYFALLQDCNDMVRLFRDAPGEVQITGPFKSAVWSQGDLGLFMSMEKDRVFNASRFQYANSAGQPVSLTLADIEIRLYGMSFDPNHPPEVRWGAFPGTPEYAAVKSFSTPLPGGKVVPMEAALEKQAYYRSLAVAEQDESYLDGMFTSGFVLRDRLTEAMNRNWARMISPPIVPAKGRAAWLADRG